MNRQALSFSAGARSEKGHREENQDRMTRFQSPFGEVLLVADGMGGHLGGATAAEIIVTKFPAHLSAMSASTPLADALQQATRVVNNEIYTRGRSGDVSVAGMGSTLAMAVIRETTAGTEVVVANAGDSRVYLFRNGGLRRLTKDHTAVQRMIDAGLLTEAGARHHPESSVLTRAIGQAQDVSLEIYPPVALQPDDELLICSDGLSGFTDDQEIENLLNKTSDPGAAVKSLIDLALGRGSDDNITVQVLRVVGNHQTVIALPERRKKSWFGTRELSYAFGGLLAVACGIGIVARMPSRIVEKKEIEVRNTAPGEAPKTATSAASRPKSQKGVVTGGATKKDAPVEHPDPKAQQGGEPEIEKVEIEVETDNDVPDWIEKIKKAPGVDVRTEGWKSAKKYKPLKRDVKLLYHPVAEKQKDRILKLIPGSVKVQVEADPKLAGGIDIVIVLPSEPDEAAEACEETIDESGQKSCAGRAEFAARVIGGGYGAKL